MTKYTSTKFFTVEKWEVEGKVEKNLDEFTLVSVLSGKGKVNDLEVSKGDHFILTSACKEAHFDGELEKSADLHSSKERAAVVCTNGLIVSKLMIQNLRRLFPEIQSPARGLGSGLWHCL